MNRRLKLLGALLLLASLFLPIARGCERVDAHGRHVSNYVYILRSIDQNEPGDWILAVFIFAWPLIAVGILAWRKKGYIALVIRILEPYLLFMTFRLVNVGSTFFVSRRAVGAYVAFAALGIYALGAFWSDVTAFRQWRHARAKIS